jgi:hypothetical protein
MTTPLNISETNERTTFTGAGPHALVTSVGAGATARFSVQIGLIIKDVTSLEVYYSGIMAVTKYDATSVAISAPNHRYCQSGLPWTSAGAPQVSFAASVVFDELVLSVTIPGGYDVELSYRIDGVYT